MSTTGTSPREAGKATLRVRALITIVVFCCLGALLAAYARGGFEEKFTITIDAERIGSGLVAGADVKLNGFAIGRVAEIETVGYGHQRIVAELEPHQVGQLTSQVRARFASSNMFGSTGIELINTGAGAPLKDGATVTIGADTTQVTVTDSLSRMSQIAAILSDDETLDLLQFFVTESRGIGTTMSVFLDTARMLRDEQRGSINKYLRVGAEMGAGVSKLAPLVVGGVVDLMHQAEYFGHQENRDRVNKAVGGLNGVLLRKGGDRLAEHAPDLVKILDTVMDLVIPIGFSLGTVAPTYNRIPELIAHIRGAFPEVAGHPQIQLELVAADFPQVIRSLTAGGGQR